MHGFRHFGNKLYDFSPSGDCFIFIFFNSKLKNIILSPLFIHIHECLSHLRVGTTSSTVMAGNSTTEPMFSTGAVSRLTAPLGVTPYKFQQIFRGTAIPVCNWAVHTISEGPTILTWVKAKHVQFTPNCCLVY